jgi:hypothetical protein
MTEAVDGGVTWIDENTNLGRPKMHPNALVRDEGRVTRTPYAGFAGVWACASVAK